MNTDVAKHVRKDAIVNFVINMLLNGLLAYFLNKSKLLLPLWGESGFGIDIFITTFLLLFLLAWILIAINRRGVQKGKAPRLSWNTELALHRVLSRFPQGAFQSGLLLGLCGLLVVAPVTVGVFHVLDVTELTPMSYAVFKGVWAGLLAALAVYLVVPIGLASAPAK